MTAPAGPNRNGLFCVVVVALLLAGGLSSEGTSANTPTLAVFDFLTVTTDTDARWIGPALSLAVSDALWQTDEFTVLDRFFLREVGREKELSLLNAYESDQALRSGRALKTDHALFGKAFPEGDQIRLVAFLLNTSSGEPEAVADLRGARAELTQLAAEIVTNLLKNRNRAVTENELNILQELGRVPVSYYERLARGEEAYDEGRGYESFGHFLAAYEEHGKKSQAGSWLAHLYLSLGEGNHADIIFHESLGDAKEPDRWLLRMAREAANFYNRTAERRNPDRVEVYRTLVEKFDDVWPRYPYFFHSEAVNNLAYDAALYMEHIGKEKEAYRYYGRALSDSSIDPFRRRMMEGRRINYWARTKMKGETLENFSEDVVKVSQGVKEYTFKFKGTVGLGDQVHLPNSEANRKVLVAPPGQVIEEVTVTVEGDLIPIPPGRWVSSQHILLSQFNPDFEHTFWNTAITQEVLAGRGHIKINRFIPSGPSKHAHTFNLDPPMPITIVGISETEAEAKNWTIRTKVKPGRAEIPDLPDPVGTPTVGTSREFDGIRHFPVRSNSHGFPTVAADLSDRRSYIIWPDIPPMRHFDWHSNWQQFRGLVQTDLWLAPTDADSGAEPIRLNISSEGRDYAPTAASLEEGGLRLAWISTRRPDGSPSVWLAESQRPEQWTLPRRFVLPDTDIEVPLSPSLIRDHRGQWLIAVIDNKNSRLVVARQKTINAPWTVVLDIPGSYSSVSLTSTPDHRYLLIAEDAPGSAVVRESFDLRNWTTSRISLPVDRAGSPTLAETSEDQFDIYARKATRNPRWVKGSDDLFLAYDPANGMTLWRYRRDGTAGELGRLNPWDIHRRNFRFYAMPPGAAEAVMEVNEVQLVWAAHHIGQSEMDFGAPIHAWRLSRKQFTGQLNQLSELLLLEVLFEHPGTRESPDRWHANNAFSPGGADHAVATLKRFVENPPEEISESYLSRAKEFIGRWRR